MAVTENLYTGDNSTVLFSFTFPYLQESDVKISLDGTLTTAYSLANATTVQFNTAPASGVAIRIFRDTENETPRAAFYPGSVIRAQDLNNNFDQVLYVTQESDRDATQALSTSNTALTTAENAVADSLAATQAYVTANTYTQTDLDSGQLDNRYYTETEADARFWNVDSAEYLSSGDTWTPDDQHIATTAAIEARVVSLVDDVGGFVPISSHTAFPVTNPDINDDAGTVVSLQDIAGFTHAAGSSTNATTTTGTAVTITGIPAVLPSPAPSGYSMLVVTTGTLNTFTFHRLTAAASDVVNVSNNTTAITVVAGEITPTNNIATVAAIDTEISTVAGVAASIPTVAANDANVTTVAGSIANVNNVGGSITNVNTVATNIADVNTVATDIADVTAVSTNIGAVAAVGSDLANSFSNIDDYGGITDPVTSTPAGTSDIQTVAANINNVNTVSAINAGVTIVAGISSNVTTVATNNANVTTVATDIANVNTNAANITNINTVAGISANVTTVAGNTANINAVAADATDIGTVAGSIANVNAVGTDIASVNTAAANLAAIIAAPTEAANAAASASAAATSETNAAASATNAATSASAAATSESNAATSASNAATSETNALASATAAASSAAAALVSETNADNSADLALQYRDDTAGILAQADSDPYTVSTNQSWGDIITGAASHFANEVLADILLTMSKGTNTYDYGTII